MTEPRDVVKGDAVYLVDWEVKQEDPVVTKVVVEALVLGEKEYTPEYLTQLLTDMIDNCGYSMAIFDTREKAIDAVHDAE